MSLYFRAFKNPSHKPGGFSHYEVQSVREFTDNLEPYIERCTEEEDCADDHPLASGPVFYTIYGRYDGTDGFGGVEAISDRTSIEAALNTLKAMGVVIDEEPIAEKQQ